MSGAATPTRHDEMSVSSGVSVTPPAARVSDLRGERPRAGYADALILTVTVSVAGCLLATAVALLLVHPDLTAGLRAFANVVNQQNQRAKTALYLVGFFVILPLTLIAVPRLADEIARGPNGHSLRGLVV